MGFKEYGNYDGLGLAELVRKKDVSAAELLDEAVKHFDYARGQIDRALPDGPSRACRSS
jgi:amidase